MKVKLLFIYFILFSPTFLLSQVKSEEIKLKDEKGNAKFIKLNTTKISSNPEVIRTFLKKQFKTDNKHYFSIVSNKDSDLDSFKEFRVQQYYKNIKVEFAQFNIVSKNGELRSINGKFVNIKDFNITPTLSEKKALSSLLKHIGANKYAWQKSDMEKFIKSNKEDSLATYFPKGKLVIIEDYKNPNNSTPLLAYKFDVYAVTPLSRANYYINASNGEVILTDLKIKHANRNHSLASNKILDKKINTKEDLNTTLVPSTATTRYSGNRTIITSNSPFFSISRYSSLQAFRLRDYAKGNGIFTLNMNRGSDYNQATDLVDFDNNWTAAEYNNFNKDNALLEAHWAAESTYNYFWVRHGRRSIDNNGFRLLNYVNGDMEPFDINQDNAFWDGEKMTYGMGLFRDPLTSLDVVAHEIGHGLDQFTSNLVYQFESGAIDEGLADIWGSMVEFYEAPEKSEYLISEDTGFPFRSMSNPKTTGDPDTYMGINWKNVPISDDNGGVHTNSGVINHWFYLLAEGSAATDGINDNLDVFNFSGIGKINAARIVYRAETVYFTSNTDYNAARVLTIQAAEDLFGTDSNEVTITTAAWYAVGLGEATVGVLIGDECACSNSNTTFTLDNHTNSVVNTTWQVSSNLQIIGNPTNTSITVKSNNSGTRAPGFVTANIGNQQVTKEIWVGRPATPSYVSGPSSVNYGAIVSYNGPQADGATSYDWYLPYTYNPNATVTTTPSQWGILSGRTTRYLSAIVGPNNGLVQFMGVNKCGAGGAKTKSVTVGNTGGGNGGPIPRNSEISVLDNTVKIYPNPVKEEFIINIGSNKSDIYIYDIYGRLIYSNKDVKNLDTVNSSLWADNVYLVKVVTENQTTNKTIIVKH